MSDSVEDILSRDTLGKDELVRLLSVRSDAEKERIFQHAAEVRNHHVGNGIYLRGLIEYSNRCEKNCFYCGIRAGNSKIDRYVLKDNEVFEAARIAFENSYGSVVLQSGESTDPEFVRAIDRLVRGIKKLSGGKLGITLSCGEQSKDVYKRWYDSGAHRYLLRIETSDPDLYYRIHPNNKKHFLVNRLTALGYLRETGYQLGTGVMIGLPGQTTEQRAEDLLFIRQLDPDMVGMGPYIEHSETPLYEMRDALLPAQRRLEQSLLMIALMRMIMPAINIASSTALDTLSSDGREKALHAGANVLMPNLTPNGYRENYFLYNKKQHLTEAQDIIRKISETIAPLEIRFGEWGDSRHFNKR
jgi:biotin synthase